jgi:hypothetical protein
MESPSISLIAFALMLAATGLGALIRRRWPEHHSNRETIELLQSTVLTLATFAAIVLGLLITSAKTDYDSIENDIRSFSSTLVQLDYGLQELGPAGVPLRQQLARYAAAGIAATWTDEAPPAGDYYPQLPQVAQGHALSSNAPILGQMLEQVDGALRAMPIATPAEARAQEGCIRLMNIAVSERWRIVEASQGDLSTPFFIMLVFWLMVIFLCFGLSAPFNHLSFMVTALSGLALASALFVIIDLYTPFTGIFTVSSLPPRQGLQEMLSLPGGLPPPFPPGCDPAAPHC